MNKAHTKHLEKDNAGNGIGCPTVSLDISEFFFLLAVQNKQRMASTLFSTWDLSINRNPLLFEKLIRANELKVKKVSLNVPDIL